VQDFDLNALTIWLLWLCDAVTLTFRVWVNSRGWKITMTKWQNTPCSD